MKNNDFAFYVSKFLTEYLAGERNLSPNTINSYRDTIVQLISFLIHNKSARLENIGIQIITKSTVEEFLDYLEASRGCSIRTRNQRLAAIHSLFRYIGVSDPKYLFQSQQILSIPNKKSIQREMVYLSLNETKTLLSSPDVNTPSGRRDQAILCLLYDSGCRVQELADLTVKDIRLETPEQVKLTGKGRKNRSVPLMKETAAILKRYIHEQGLDCPEKFDRPLFFNSQGKKLTRQGITYILKKYTSENALEITPHSLRHSKAMHLTESDVNPVFIRDFLGHSDLKTTQIYSRASVEMKRKAINTLFETSPLPAKPAAKNTDWTEDKNLMDWLRAL